MDRETKVCCWCDKHYFPNELSGSRFLGGLACPSCNADEPNRTIGEIHEKLKQRSFEAACGGDYTNEPYFDETRDGED